MIREATKADVPRIVEIGRHFLAAGPYSDQIDNPEQATNLALRTLESNNGKILVLEKDGEVMGVFAFILFNHYFTGEFVAGELIWFVEPEARPGGGGLNLLAEAERLARNCGAKRMQLTAPTQEVGALYKRCGGYKQLEVSYERHL